MIFLLHYILMTAGLPAIIVLLTLFLQTYSDASMTEIGTLLMVLPFLSTITKPLVCALADRHQAHKYYLMGSNFFMALGYGSLVIPAFFPEFVQEHGRLIWYLYIFLILIGFNAFSVVWSLGDALVLNAARRRGVPWSFYRAFATLSWGIFGLIIGAINETPLLPKYTPAYLLLVAAVALENLILAFWPNKDFQFLDEDASAENKQIESHESQHQQQQQTKQIAIHNGNQQQFSNKSPNRGSDDLEMAERAATSGQSPGGSLRGNGTLRGTLRLDPRLVGAVANIILDDIGDSINSSLRRQAPKKRPALAELLDEHDLGSGEAAGADCATPTQFAVPAAAPQGVEPQNSRASTFGRAAMRRAGAALSRMNSLSSASGLAIVDDFRSTGGRRAGATSPTAAGAPEMAGATRHAPMFMSSLASGTSLSKATAARALAFNERHPDQPGTPPSATAAVTGKEVSPLPLPAHSQRTLKQQPSEEPSKEPAKDLQIVLIKLIIRRNAKVLKFLIMFTIYGILLYVHLIYFFIQVEELCKEKGYDFSSVIGAMLACQSISEIFSFTILSRYYLPLVGQTGGMITTAIIFAARYSYYGTYYPETSPYTGLISETCHGFAYGMVYSLVTEVAAECVDHIDEYLPELIARRIVAPDINPNVLKLPLRTTMQGIFSGAFDGLGQGVACLVGGIFLDHYSFKSLWLVCTAVSVISAVFYPLSELGSVLRARRSSSRQQVICGH